MKQKRFFFAMFSTVIVFCFTVHQLWKCKHVSKATTTTARLAQQRCQQWQRQLHKRCRLMTLSGCVEHGTQIRRALRMLKLQQANILRVKLMLRSSMLLIDWGSYQQKRDLMLAANEKVDLCFTASWCGYVQGLAKGEYMNIKDLIDANCPKSKALVVNTPLWLGPQSKGGIYGMPVNKEAGQDWGFMYRKDITDKHGLDMNTLVPQNSNPLTMIDEYEKVLYQIHKLEPTLTAAQSADLRPFYQDGAFDNLSGEVDYLGVKAIGNKLTAIDTLEQPQTMQAWQKTHKWYKDGLVQTDVLVDQEHNNTAQQQGTVFSAIFNLKPYKDAETNAGAAKGIVWQQVDMTPPRANTDVVTGTIWAVPSYCSNPARALMCLDLINTDTYLNNLLNFGIEGTNYVKAGANRIDFPAGVTAQTDSYFPNDMPFFANQFANYLWPAEKDDKWQKYAAFNKTCLPTKIIGFSFDPTPVKTQIAAFDNIRKQYNDQLAYGVADPTVVGPQYIAKMKQAGMAAVLAELQKQLDAWVASK